MSLMVTFICRHCKAKVQRPEHYGVLKYCSIECKRADKKVGKDKLVKLADRGLTRKEAATAIGCSYPTVIRAIKRFDVNHLFPPNGVASSWASTRG